MDEDVIKYAKDKYENIDMLINVFSMQIIWISDSLAKKLEYSQEELKGQSIRKILEISTQEMVKAFSDLFNKGGQDKKILKAKTGNKFQVTATLFSFSYEKEPHIAVTNVKA